MKNKTTLYIPHLGIDVGRVLIAPDGADGADTSFIGGSMQDALATPPYEGMFDHVPELVERLGGRVWIVSKAGPKVQEKTLRWMEHHRFHERTGIPAAHVHFCRERHQKADHCRRLAITHFIDDRTDVLHHLRGIVTFKFLFGPQKENAFPDDTRHVPNWPATKAAVLSSL